jgi:PAS domain S-box-containing protein
MSGHEETPGIGGRRLNESRVEYDFRKIAEAMPQLVWRAAPDGRIDYFNERWIDYTGLTVDDTRNGRIHVVHPDDADAMQHRWQHALDSGEPYEIEYRLQRAADRSYRWFLARAVPIYEAGRIAYWIGTATDIDVQRRARDSLAFVVEATSAISKARDLHAICSAVARVAVEQFADWCFVTLKENDGYTTVATAHENQAVLRDLEMWSTRYPAREGGLLDRVVKNNEPLLVERVTPAQLAAGSVDAEHLRLLQQLQMHSAIIVPLSSEGGAYGALSLVSAESGRLFDRSDLDVAMLVASRAALAIENTQLLREEQQTSQRLRFTAKASRMLFESFDLDETFDRVAHLIASSIADACFIARIEDDAVRAVACAHRDPALEPLVMTFKGTRTLMPDAERALIARLRSNRPILRSHVDLQTLKSRGWPYLAHGIDALRPTSAVVVPLYARRTTYGAIFCYYTDSGRVYSAADLPVLVEIASRASIAIENAQTLERERRIATTFQQASLPALIPKPPGLHFDAVYSAAGEREEVGGDWYDAIDLDDGSVVVSVGDVTGQGLEAAIIMSKVRHALGVVPRHEPDPARMLDSTGWFLHKRYPEAIVTAFVGVISPDRRTIRYASAGHPYPILRRNDQLIELESSGLPLGLRPLSTHEPSSTMRMQDGDLLVLYTDGLTEWGRDWEIGERRLRDVLSTDALLHSSHPARMIQRACIPSRAHDDVAILTVRFGPGPHWVFNAEDARAAENARLQFVAYLRERTSDRSLIENSELVFGELIGNVVRHAPGPVEVELDWNNGRPVLHVIDAGPPFTVPHSLPDALSESGRGLYIVQMVSKELSVERIDDVGNHVQVLLTPSI